MTFLETFKDNSIANIIKRSRIALIEEELFLR